MESGGCSSWVTGERTWCVLFVEADIWTGADEGNGE